MRFLRKSLMGLFLLAATLALFAYAIMMVRGAIENKGDDQRRGGGGRERIFAVNAVPFEPGQQRDERTHQFGSCTKAALETMETRPAPSFSRA